MRCKGACSSRSISVLVKPAIKINSDLLSVCPCVPDHRALIVHCETGFQTTRFPLSTTMKVVFGNNLRFGCVSCCLSWFSLRAFFSFVFCCVVVVSMFFSVCSWPLGEHR